MDNQVAGKKHGLFWLILLPLSMDHVFANGLHSEVHDSGKIGFIFMIIDFILNVLKGQSANVKVDKNVINICQLHILILNRIFVSVIQL